MKRFALFLVLLLVPHLAQATLAVKDVKSPKGISAWLEEDDSQPIVAISFSWQGGFENDPENRQGLSMVATDMLTHGAGTLDDNAFQRAVQQASIDIDFDARRDFIGGALRCLKDKLPQATQLLHDAVTAPLFSKEALERQKTKAASRLKFQLADPDWVLLRMGMRETFAGHPYGKRALGTADSIKAITVDDVKAWHKQFARGDLLVTATGAITPAELSHFLDAAFGDLPETAPEKATPEAPFSIGGKSYEFTIPGPQAQLLMEWPGLKRKDPDWYAGEVMDYILGGGSFSSRMMKEIREKRGLTYGISSDQSPLQHAALYTVQASFQGKNAGQVLQLANDEVKKIIDAPVGADELQAAKDYLIGAYPLQLTSSSAIAGHLLQLRQIGLPVDEKEKRAAAIAKVTPQDVQRVAKKIFAQPAAVFFVGAPEGVSPQQRFDKID